MNTRQILEEFPAYLEANRLARPQHKNSVAPSVPRLRFFQARGGHAGAAGVTHKDLIFSGVGAH